MLLKRTVPRDQQKAELLLAQKEAQRENVRARLIEARARVAFLQSQIENASVYARRPGFVVFEEFMNANPRRKIRAGDRVTETPGIVTVADVDRMLVETSVGEADVHRVAVGQVVHVVLEALRDRKFTGKVTRVGTVARSSAERPMEDKRFDLIVEIDQPDPQLKPEMTARVDVQLGERRGVLVIPPNAVFDEQGVSAVHVVRAFDVQTRMVQLGESTGTAVEVVAGLEEGERVLLDRRPAFGRLEGDARESRHRPGEIGGWRRHAEKPVMSAASPLPRKLHEALRVALEAQGRYKLRTSLSVLGVVLGVAAVIAMMSVTEGARRDALEQVQLLGLDNLVARNRMLTIDESRGGSSAGLTLADAQRLPALVPSSAGVSPLVERLATVSQRGRNLLVPLVGIRPSYQGILNLQAGRGRLLSYMDEHSGSHVAVLGAQLARRLFGYADPVDQLVRLQGQYYRIVGVLADRGGRSPSVGALAWRDLNNSALAPLATVSKLGLDVMPAQRVDEIWLQAADGDRVEPTSQVLRQALKSLHRGQEDFDIVIPRELLEQRYRTQRTFSVVVGSVAVLALVIGGIGIMNIMLTSVVERTHEIGIRRTVGATRRDIATQFLIETLLMTVGGGLFGIVVGAVVSVGITAYADWSTRVSPLAVALAFGVSISVGLVFGIYPATKAAQLEPIDAVRYE